jgi:hypothetical protein
VISARGRARNASVSTTSSRSTVPSRPGRPGGVEAGQREQVVDEAGEAAYLAGQLPGVRAACTAPGDLELGEQRGDRAAQLVRRVGDELALLGQRGVDAVQQVVQRRREPGQLVAARRDVDPEVQVGGGDPRGLGAQDLDRPQRAADHDPGECAQRGGEDRQPEPEARRELRGARDRGLQRHPDVDDVARVAVPRHGDRGDAVRLALAEGDVAHGRDADGSRGRRRGEREQARLAVEVRGGGDDAAGRVHDLGGGVAAERRHRGRRGVAGVDPRAGRERVPRHPRVQRGDDGGVHPPEQQHRRPRDDEDHHGRRRDGEPGPQGTPPPPGAHRAQPPDPSSRYPMPRTVRIASRPNGTSTLRRRRPT